MACVQSLGNCYEISVNMYVFTGVTLTLSSQIIIKSRRFKILYKLLVFTFILWEVFYFFNLIKNNLEHVLIQFTTLFCV